jgi:hypothetical protein
MEIKVRQEADPRPLTAYPDTQSSGGEIFSHPGQVYANPLLTPSLYYFTLKSRFVQIWLKTLFKR